MKRLLLGFALFLTAAGAAAFDLGGNLETTGGWNGSRDPKADQSVSWGTTGRFWLGGTLSPGLTYAARVNVTNNLTVGLTKGSGVIDSVTGGLDTLLLESSLFRLGRTDVRDFSGTVLNTKLDAAQLMITWAKIDFHAFVGSSALVFKSASTVIIGEQDLKDRQVTENLSQLSSLWAPPRAIAGFEASARQWLRDQTFQLSLLGQADLRPGSPKDGDLANTDLSARTGAPVSTAYAGLGWNGRLFGPFYGSAWVYGMGGSSLTAVGNPITISSGSKGVPNGTYQTWKSSLMVGALGNAEVTLLLPSLQYLLLSAGVQVGSWDPDGATPDKNAGTSPQSDTPSLYTGWTGISQTGGSLIFNPQPTNLVNLRLVASAKPFDGIQVASTTFVVGRPTDGPISETGLDGKSTALYLGTESDLAVLWRPASDLGLTFSAGLFAPNPDAMTRDLEYKLQATAGLSF